MDLTRSGLALHEAGAAADAGASDAGILAGAVMLAAAALVHLALAPEHFAQWRVGGALFAAAAGLQIVLAVVLLRTPTRNAIAAVFALNAAIIAVWLWSRSTGVPIGPQAGHREAIGWLDVATTFDELLLLVLLSIEAGWTALARSGRAALACRACGTTLAVLLTLAFAGGVGHG